MLTSLRSPRKWSYTGQSVMEAMARLLHVQFKAQAMHNKIRNFLETSFKVYTIPPSSDTMSFSIEVLLTPSFTFQLSSFLLS